MRKHTRDVLRLVAPVISSAGGRCWLEFDGRPHPRLYVALGDKQRFVVLSSSPRDPGALTYESLKRVKILLHDMQGTT